MSTLKADTITAKTTDGAVTIQGNGTGTVAIADNTAISGTATVSSTLGVTGATTLAAVTASGTPTFSSTDNMSVGGNIVLTTAAKGIYLGVTGATAANLLDDYEEGTWTATLIGATTAGLSPTDAGAAVYTKIGNMCYVSVAFANVNCTGAVGTLRVTGLPFSANPGNQMTGNCSLHTCATIDAGVRGISPFFQGALVDFYGSVSQAGWSAIQVYAGTGRYLYFTGWYKV